MSNVYFGVFANNNNDDDANTAIDMESESEMSVTPPATPPPPSSPPSFPIPSSFPFASSSSQQQLHPSQRRSNVITTTTNNNHPIDTTATAISTTTREQPQQQGSDSTNHHHSTANNQNENIPSAAAVGGGNGSTNTNGIKSITSINTNHQNQQSRGCRHQLKAPPPNSFNVSSQQDKQRALRLIQQPKDGQAKTIWEHLPDVWKRDKGLILAALNNHAAELPPKSQFERTFPQSLRFDKDIVLAFCNRPDFSNNNSSHHKNRQYNNSSSNNENNTRNQQQEEEQEEDRGLYYERHLFVPGCLTNDKDVMMAYCRKIPRSLQDCSEELCNDRDIVITAITHCGGLELQYASVQLQQDIDIVKLACAYHGRAIEYCPLLSSTRQTLLHDRTFMLHVVLNHPTGGPMWKLLPTAIRNNDQELVLQALTNGLLLRDVPKQYISLEFLIQALRRNPSLYLQLKYLKVHPPPDLFYINSNNTSSSSSTTTTSTIARTSRLAAATADTTAATTTTECSCRRVGEEGCPTLKEDRRVVLAICQRGTKEFLQDILVTTTTTNNNNQDDNNNHDGGHDDNDHVGEDDDNDNDNDETALAAILHFNMELPPEAPPAVNPSNHNINNNDNVVNILPPVPDNLAADADAVNHIHRRRRRNAARFRPPRVARPRTRRTTTTVTSRSRFCDDLDVMKLAVQRDASFFSAASLRLQAEPELILCSITPETAFDNLRAVPWSIRRDHPEITIKAIELCEWSNLRDLPTHIPEELWINYRDICTAWIRRGQQVLDVFEPMLRDDVEMALLVAKHNWSQFHKVGERFLADRDVILQAVELDGGS
ncbi:protein of unknown function DUF4116 containing protein [Nitzschia inconspicua]|uniref:DUF4116 domain-containing protein n=1 Tax=Nitzschia inconspicua TaxID=303405 RepID=A0A9K3K6D6_9STRA|nr:protein of unknown function DUF4116 containing protein [Nitzschia inconspicua]